MANSTQGTASSGGSSGANTDIMDILGQQIPGQPPPLSGKIPIMNSIQVANIVAPTVLYTLATGAVAVRFWSRRAKRQPLGIDDWLCLLALILGYGQHATNLVLILAGGVALPLISLSLPTIWIMFKALIANYTVYIVNVAVLQLSILFFYTRMFGIKQSFRIACHIVAGIIAAWAVAGVFTRIFACGSSIEKDVFVIDTSLPGQCVNELAICGSISILHVIFDFSVLALPVPLIWRLKMSTFHKAVVTATLSAGVFATVCAVLRMECLITLFTENPEDVTQVLGITLIYQSLETPIGLICICVPTLAPLWTKIRESKLGSYTKRLLSRSGGSTKGSNFDTSGTKERSDNFEAGKKFIRLDNDQNTSALSRAEDEIPLHEVKIDASHNISTDSEYGRGIKVSRDWDVGRN